MTNVELLRTATQQELDLAMTALRINGVRVTADALAECIAEQRRIDSSAAAETLLTLDIAASLLAGLTDDDVQAKAEGHTVADVLAGIAAVKQLLRDIVSASDANDGGSLMNCIEDARAMVIGNTEESDNLWKCGACGYESDEEEFDRCPDCGVPDQCFEVC